MYDAHFSSQNYFPFLHFHPTHVRSPWFPMISHRWDTFWRKPISKGVISVHSLPPPLSSSPCFSFPPSLSLPICSQSISQQGQKLLNICLDTASREWPGSLLVLVVWILLWTFKWSEHLEIVFPNCFPTLQKRTHIIVVAKRCEIKDKVGAIALIVRSSNYSLQESQHINIHTI